MYENTRQNIIISYLDTNNEYNIPMNILTQILTGLQKTVYLIAMEVENKTFSERARIPDEIETAYSLKCSIPIKGSYSIPTFIDPIKDDLFPEYKGMKIQETVNCFEKAIKSIINNDFNEYITIFKNKILSNRILSVITRMLPSEDSKWKFKVKVNENEDNTLDCIHTENIKYWNFADKEEDFQTITGQLKAIDFQKRKLELLYPITNRKLECSYEESIEDLLLENRRDWIQITGIVELNNKNGEIIKIKKVNDITDLDLSNFILKEVIIDKKHKLFFKNPLILKPEHDSESYQYLIIEHRELGIFAYNTTRSKLHQSVCEQIIINWKEIAKEDDTKLSPETIIVKRNLLNSINEVFNEG